MDLSYICYIFAGLKKISKKATIFIFLARNYNQSVIKNLLNSLFSLELHKINTQRS